MVKVRCQDCGNISEQKLKKGETPDDYECGECSGSLAEYGSEDDEYEPATCPECGKELSENDDTWTCEECDEENFCEDCICTFESANSSFCKKCMREAYPGIEEPKVEIKTQVVEKEVKVFVDKDGNPINSFNPNNKTRFD